MFTSVSLCLLSCQITACTQPLQWTSWAPNPSWCAALLPPYALSSKAPGFMVRWDKMLHSCKVCVTRMIVAASKVMFLLLFLSMPEPNFVSMAQMPESEKSDQGDDDKVYLFFSETAVECDCYNKLVVSRVARVCKVKTVYHARASFSQLYFPMRR